MIKQDDNNIFIDSKTDLIDLKKLECSKSGSTSDIYKFYKDIILKIYKQPHSLNKIEIYDLIRQLDLKNITVPLKYVFIDELFYGYSMKLMKGKNILNLNPNLKLEDIFLSLPSAERTIRSLSDNNIEMNDINSFNILFDIQNHEFNIIDFDFYNILPNTDKYELCFSNSLEFNMELLTCLTKEFDVSRQDYPLFQKLRAYVMIKTFKGDDFTTIFKYVKGILEDVSNKQLNTLGDMRKVMRLYNVK